MRHLKLFNESFDESINEDIVRLRKLTTKSIIGFGQFRDMTVQNLLDLHKEKDLISIYYKLENIDFDDNIKQQLCITGDRVIDKPGKDPEKYTSLIYEIIGDIKNSKNPEEQQRMMNIKMGQYSSQQKHRKSRMIGSEKRDLSKGFNQQRNLGR